MLLLAWMLALPTFFLVLPISSAVAVVEEEKEGSRQIIKRTLLWMETKEIAPNVSMPVMSIGTGGQEHGNAKQIVSNWLTVGGRAIDTALNYGNQDQVRQAIQESATELTRDDVFITTKIPDCNVTNVAQYIQQDLQLLGTTYVDLLLIHGPRRGDCVETWKYLEHAYLNDKTARAIGVSNFRTADLEPLLQHGTVVPHVNQIQLNLLHKDVDTIRYCDQHGIVVEAYSPLGRAGTRGDLAHNKVIQGIAQAHGNVTIYQVALKWILQHGWILTFQSSSRQHQEVDADVFHFTLSDEEMKRLDALSSSDSVGV
ncbi:Deoxymugineic acid synthase 1 [Seminavis robusta]|uniref:Deoxymugineic acid synthase 1 n=1 Tax=Seminavis robusta TaxID=568900 RepID=A0A9N8DHF4_9STRA|nr:Deoxymugineic acid synthase 1 [Seminavis robusta]|eukprot:Sro129_g061530.1 Deoxymugineic acid synthase 1 (313) ;mRNA; f:41361-42299